MFRAYDKRDGKVVWEAKMPTLVTGAPMTYELNGRQYIVVAVSKRGEPAELVALTLDGASENGAAPAGGVPLAAAPPSTRPPPGRVGDAGGAGARQGRSSTSTCAMCHGPNGAGMQGGSAPPLTNRTDFANIARVITGARARCLRSPPCCSRRRSRRSPSMS